MEYAVRILFEGGSSKFGDAENMEFKLEGLNVNRYQISDIRCCILRWHYKTLYPVRIL